MAEQIKLVQEEPTPILRVNKWKFITWVFIVTIIMLFASQTSAYLVRRAEGNWVEFSIPTIFYYSTAVLLLSSVFLQLAYQSAKKDDFMKVRSFMLVAFISGIVFLVMQYFGWKDLQAQGVFLKGNPSGSFFYVLTGLHAFHLITGLVVMLYAMKAAFRKEINAKELTTLEVCNTYWHFLDLLWLYLFVFLLYFR